MRQLFFLVLACFAAVLLLPLAGCEEEHLRVHTLDEMSGMAADTSSLQLAEKRDSTDSVPAPLPVPDTIAPPPAALPDTAVDIVDYRDSIAGGSAPWQGDGDRETDVIVVHSSYYAYSPDTFSVRGVISQYERYGVSAHYLIDRDARVLLLVAENDTSFHAGDSRLPADPERTALNGTSIGIEVMNSEESGPTAEQYDALVALVKNIMARRPIHYVYRHSDIAPTRKTDPWRFDWDGLLARLGWQNPQPPSRSLDEDEQPAGSDAQEEDAETESEAAGDSPGNSDPEQL